MAITTEIALEILRAYRDRDQQTKEEPDAPTVVLHLDEIAKGVHYGAARPDARIGIAAKVWLESSQAARRHAAAADLKGHRLYSP